MTQAQYDLAETTQNRIDDYKIQIASAEAIVAGGDTKVVIGDAQHHRVEYRKVTDLMVYVIASLEADLAAEEAIFAAI